MNASERRQERPREGGVRASQFVAALLMTFVLYALSAGPVVRLALDDRIPYRAIEVVYAPLGWVTETNIGETTLKPFFDWYGGKLWGWHFEFVQP